MSRKRNLDLSALTGAATPRSDGNMASYRLAGDRRGQSEAVIERVPLSLIDRSRFQARRDFDEDKLRLLAESIGRDGSGLVHPPTVRRVSSGRYELIAGERRVRAALLNGIMELPVYIRDMSDAEALVSGCRENLDRATLLPWEMCMAYVSLRDVAREHLRANAGAGKVAELLGQHRRSVAASYLQAGDAIPLDMLLRAGAGTGREEELDPVVLRALSLVDMLSVAAKATEAERLAHLTSIVDDIRGEGGSSVPGGEADIETTSVTCAAQPRQGKSPRAASRKAVRFGDRPAESAYESLLRRGGFQKNIRAPIGELLASDAARHLDTIAPAVAALATRAMLDAPDAVRVIEVVGAPVKLLAVRAEDDRWMEQLRVWAGRQGDA